MMEKLRFNGLIHDIRTRKELGNILVHSQLIPEYESTESLSKNKSESAVTFSSISDENGMFYCCYELPNNYPYKTVQFQLSFAIGEDEPFHQETIEVEVGKDYPCPIELELPKVESNVFFIRGHLLDAANKSGLPKLRVQAQNRQAKQGVVLTTRTDQEGNFRLTYIRENEKEDNVKELAFAVFYDSEQAIHEEVRKIDLTTGEPEVFHIKIPEAPTLKQHHIIAQLLNKQDKQPLGGARVQARLLNRRFKIDQEFPIAFTNDQGLFRLEYFLPKIIELKQATVALEIFGVSEEPITKRVRLRFPLEKIRQIRVEVPQAEDAISIGEVKKHVKIPPKLSVFLEEKKINTLHDIAVIGGLARQNDLPVKPTLKSVQQLDAHAQLGILSRDVAANNQLIRKGFPSVSAIAHTDIASFTAQVGDTVGRDQAQALHVAALTTQSLITNVVTSTLSGSPYTGVRDDEDPLLILEEEEENCHCDDCEALVSPRAYLADLLNYALDYIENNGAAIDLGFLQDTFHQPFKDIPATCEAQEEKLCQKRIATEVLCAYIQSLDSSAVDQSIINQGEKAYWVAVYQSMLQQIGTDYTEIRNIRYEQAEERQKLADRLSIDLNDDGSRPDHLDQLHIDIRTFPTNQGEAKMETLFGYRDTKRDQLSATPQGEIEQWRLEHLRKLWGEQDWLDNDYSQRRLPIIDPDLISIDDMRKDDSGAPYLNWKHRRYWVDELLEQRFNQTLIRGAYSDNTILYVPNVDLTADLATGDSLKIYTTATDYTVSVNTIEFKGEGTLIHTDTPITLTGTEQLTEIELVKTKATLLEAPDTISIAYEDLLDDIIAADAFETYDGTTLQDTFSALSGSVNLQFDLANRKTILTRVSGNYSAPLDNIQYKVRHTIGEATLDVDSVLTKMLNPFAYTHLIGGATITKTIWSGSAAVGNIISIKNDLTQGLNVDTHSTTLQNDYKLEKDAFLRLVELYEKSLLSFVHPDNEALSDEEEQEFVSILAQSVKQAFYIDWITEEDTSLSGITFNNNDFWQSLREPEEGSWPVTIVQGVPLVDPALISLKALPEHHTATIDLWNTRKTQLSDLVNDYSATYNNNGFDILLEKALNDGVVFVYDTINNLSDTDTYWSSLVADLESADQLRIDWAKAEIASKLRLSLEDFLFINEIRAVDWVPLQNPKSQDLAKVFQILVEAHKHKYLYPAWYANEEADYVDSTTTKFEYWLALKAKLPKWRGSSVHRQKWQDALKSLLEEPMIDPDIVGPPDFVLPTSGNVYNTWLARWTWVDNELDAIAAPGTLQAKIAIGLGVSVSYLEGLRNLEEMGERIAGHLEQLTLNFSRFRFLMNIVDLYQASPSSVTDTEWNELYELLVQVKKERNLHLWHEGEKNLGVTHSQDYFKMRTAGLSTFPIDPEEGKSKWLYSWKKRKQWQRKLKSRVEQEETVIAGIRTAVEETEDASLHILRDAFIESVALSGENLISAAKRLTDLLLIDMQENCCKKVTRVSQAIETAQLILWSLRTQQLADTYPDLVLDRDQFTFDDEWKWLGAYSAWRAAMFVFIYPQNLVYPTLRKKQTPGFLNLVKSVRGNKRFTPEHACVAASNYMEYFTDVTNLQVEATATTSIRIYEDGCNQNGQNEAIVFFKFGRSPESKKAYFSLSDPNSYEENTYWEPIDEIEEVLEIFGASIYRYSENSLLYLFYKRRKEEETTFSYVTYDLDNNRWNSPNDLELPREGDDFTAIVKQDFNEDQVPHIGVQYSYSHLFLRKMNSKADDWAEEEWDFQFTDWYYIKSIVAINSEEWVLIAQGHGGDTKIYYRIMGAFDDGSWDYVNGNIRNYVGAWYGDQDDNRVFIFYREGGFALKYFTIARSTVVSVKLYYPNGYSYPDPSNDPNDMGLFDKIKHNTGMDLTRIKLPGRFGGAFHNQTSTENILELIQYVASLPNWLFHSQITLGFHSSVSQQDHLFNNLRKYLQHEVALKYPKDKESVWAYADKYLRNFSNTAGLAAFFFRLLGHTNTSITPGIVVLKQRDRSNEISFGSLTLFYPYQKITPTAGRLQVNGLPASLVIEDSSVHSRFYFGKTNGEFTSLRNLTYLQPYLYHDKCIEPYHDYSAAELQLRKESIYNLYLYHEIWGQEHAIDYLRELVFDVPIHLANQLCHRGHFIESLDWYRSVYDYSRPVGSRKIFYGLVKEESLGFAFSRVANWLLDPLNPHRIASTRRNTYTEFTIISIVRCLLAYADAEYSSDTAESIPRARTLYQTALELLSILKPAGKACGDILGTLDIEIGDGHYEEVWKSYLDLLSNLNNPVLVQGTVNEIHLVMARNVSIQDKLSEVDTIVQQALVDDEQSNSIEQSLAKNAAFFDRQMLRVSSHKTISPAIKQAQQSVVDAYRVSVEETRQDLFLKDNNPLSFELNNSVTRTEKEWRYGYYEMVLVPTPIFTFCVPPNPVINMLCLKAEVNLFKIRNCMNIAGVVRELEPYAAPTDTTSGLPQIGAGGNLQLPGAFAIQPTQYRYSVLIERAKQLVGIAQQIESAFLSALEKRDAEYYNLMKAKQDLALSKAGIRLQTLRVKEAESGINLAELQTERAQIQVDGLQEMIDAGLNEFEQKMMDNYETLLIGNLISAVAKGAIDVLSIVTNDKNPITKAITALGAGILTGVKIGGDITSIIANYNIQRNSLLASLERRQQEWNFQKSLASQDIRIGQQQVKIAEQRVRVVNQEKVLSEMQNEFAQETVEFLTNKFTNVELYEWMSQQLEGVYAHFLQEATAMAKLATNQLAFERQEVPPPFIQNDYWEAPTDSAILGNDSKGVDRRGLTGSARLLQDVYQLDQYAFDTDQRKLQLTKTISLAAIAPIQFQQFRETGVISFGLPMEMFDRDFPGHYLRLIKQVKTSVIALIPPIDGIKATLTNVGNTRVTIGGDIFQTIPIRRSPESVALTSPREATGLFELQAQAEGQFLKPFEGIGVDSFWEFRMEKASNQIDYNTVADIIITLEYTALNSFDYRRQVIQNLDSFVSADRLYSFKNEFADQWYDLHHPAQTSTPMQVNFETLQSDFPPNLKDLAIKHVAVYLVRKSGITFNDLTLNLQHATAGNADAQTEDGLASSRKGSGSGWTLFAGKPLETTWTLSFDTADSNRFANEEIEDILFVVTYEGEQEAWL